MAAALPHRLTLLAALAALVVLTLGSWAFSLLPLGAAGPVLALTIAAIKAIIVAIAFMEIRHAGTAPLVIAATVIGFIVLLSLGTVADVALR